MFDERFSPSGYYVHYVHQVSSDACGKPVAIKGRLFLSISIPGTSTGGAAGAPTFIHHVLTPNLPEVVQIKKSGEVGKVVSFGIGLRHRNGFRVFRMRTGASGNRHPALIYA